MKGTSGTAVLLPAKWKLKASCGLFSGNAEGAGEYGRSLQKLVLLSRGSVWADSNPGKSAGETRV